MGLSGTVSMLETTSGFGEIESNEIPRSFSSQTIPHRFTGTWKVLVPSDSHFRPNSQLWTSYLTSNTMYGCSHSVISLGRWSCSVNYMLLTSSHSEPLTQKTYSMVVTDRQTDGGQMDRNVTYTLWSVRLWRDTTAAVCHYPLALPHNSSTPTQNRAPALLPTWVCQ